MQLLLYESNLFLNEDFLFRKELQADQVRRVYVSYKKARISSNETKSSHPPVCSARVSDWPLSVTLLHRGRTTQENHSR